MSENRKAIVMPASERPLSPHLQVYKLPLTAKMSITHRITGAGLALGTVLVTGFFLAAASGREAYDLVMGWALHPFGQFVLFLWSVALYFHMCNGVRHMIWDMGKCLDKDKAVRTNYIVLLFAFLLTLVTWVVAYGQGA